MKPKKLTINNATNILQSAAEIRKLIDYNNKKETIRNIRNLTGKIEDDANQVIRVMEELQEDIE